MKKISNINYITKNDLCVGCGICSSSCPTHAIQIKAINGLYKPVVDETKCINKKGCFKCRQSCPGDGIQLNNIAEELFNNENNIKHDQYLGNYIELKTGFSSIIENRFHSSSGGLTTQFLIYLYEKKYINGAVVSTFDKEMPYLNSTFIAMNKEDIINSRGSKYCPVSMENIIDEILKKDGKFVIVGLPCHIHAFRKYEKTNLKFKNKIFAYFGLYCSCGRNFNLTSYTFKENKINKSNLTYFAYRDEGCLGSMVAKQKTNDSKYVIKQKYEDYYLSLRSFFNVKRCMLCVDHFAELADISFGDIHYGKYIEDKIGVNSVIIRKNFILDLINDAIKEKYITINPLDSDTLLKSQGYAFTKKNIHPSYIRIEKLLKHKIPVYDSVDLKNNLINDFLNFRRYIIKLIQIYIGSHKRLWFLIKLLHKDMHDFK